MIVTRFAPAKINLFLHVGPAQADGRHPLDSLVMFASDLGDWVSAAPASDLTLDISGPFASALLDEPDNLMLRAARALADAAGLTPLAALQLDKHLPVASGIGGGSADAAATLWALNQLWGLNATLEELTPIAASLGADVPACLQARTLRMFGTGENVRHADGAPLIAVLVNPGVPLAAGAVYRAFDASGGGGGPAAPQILPAAAPALILALGGLRNDLEEPAKSLAPEVASALVALADAAPNTLVRMSGSGATCFALFADEAHAAKAMDGLHRTHPRWWIAACRLGEIGQVFA
jgi:4-diphosphocytidyl-2-C-methyl-D-erythritol kinase